MGDYHDMKNVFFQRAFRQAGDVLFRKNRLLRLVGQLFLKLQKVDGGLNVQSVQQKFFVIGRLSRAYALGHYRDIPWKSMLIVVAAIIYFINPLDLIPDIIPFTGFTDDFGVLLWVYSTLSNEIDRFLEWERAQPIQQ